MRAVVQRVVESSVTVDDVVVGKIGVGLLVLLGIAASDQAPMLSLMADKIAQLRIFNDAEGKFNLSVKDISGAILLVSQFTLLADTRRGRRPSFTESARPEIAAPLIEEFAERLRNEHGIPVEMGQFGAHMQVHLINDGPATIVLDSSDQDRPRRSAS